MFSIEGKGSGNYRGRFGEALQKFCKAGACPRCHGHTSGKSWCTVAELTAEGGQAIGIIGENVLDIPSLQKAADEIVAQWEDRHSSEYSRW